MKWVSLLKDIKDKVGFSAPTSAASSSAPYSEQNSNNATSSSYDDPFSRERYELELDFKRCWDEFRTSTSEMEKEKALNVTIDVFCRLVKQHPNIAQLNTLLVETHIFSFVVGRAFVSDIERLKVSSKTRSLEIESVISFFSEDTQDEILYGSNLLLAVGFLVSGPIDKQSLLDSGIMCCLVHILDALLASDGGSVSVNVRHEVEEDSEVTENVALDRRFEVEGSILHIMKALASHHAAAQGLIEDNSLKQLFEVVANASLVLFSKYKQGLVPLHTIQLHRHAMQVLGLLLSNDNGSTAGYIRKHQLIKVLLMGVKGFSPESGDPAYTMGIVDLLFECVELSYRHEAGGIRLREDIHNAHGYQFLIQFALVLSGDQFSQNSQQNPDFDQSKSTDTSSDSLSPTLSRLLDVIVNLSQTGSSTESTGSPNSTRPKIQNHPDDNYKVKDLDAVQMLQDIFLKAKTRNLQSEVLNRMFKIFSSHLDNYMLCQQLRTVPLLILNMGGFPSSFQEIILKILEYAVTVVNCIPEQELLSLCCLLQQSVTSDLKRVILSFFVKLVSFDQKYKKFLREVGVIDVLLDDLKSHKFLVGPDQNSESSSGSMTPNGFMKHLDGKDAILSSPKMLETGGGSGSFLIFEDEGVASVGWDCLVSLLRKAEHNQGMFRSSGGVVVALPFLACDVHRAGVLRVLSCLIVEDSTQAHPDELGSLIEALKSGMVITTSGSQYKLTDDAKCDIFASVWRALGANTSAQRVFGESTGFSLILTTLHSFHNKQPKSPTTPTTTTKSGCMKVFTYMLRVITAGTSNNHANRTKLHATVSSHTFCDLLCESGLMCVEYEKEVMQLLFELALEILIPPPFKVEGGEGCSGGYGKQRVYNAGAVKVLIRLLLVFSHKLQLEFLVVVEELARGGCFNQESLTSAGCVELLLETIHPFLSGSSPLLSHTLKIIEILGSYRLSSPELRVIIRYILQVKHTKSGQTLIDMMERFTFSENIPLAPFIELDMTKSGHASIQVPLGQRTWPPAAGYSFICWFQFQNFLKPDGSTPSQHAMRIFSVTGTDTNSNTSYAEIYLLDDGTLTLSTSNSNPLSFSGLDLDEYRWHHLAVVHSKPNALAGLFQASVSCIYLNGKLKHTGRLGYSPSSSGKSLQVTIGTPVGSSRVTPLSWKIRSCYLFEEVLTPGSIFFMYILGRGYRGLFQDTCLLRFVPNQACGGGSMSILDALETDLVVGGGGCNLQKPPESGSKVESCRSDRSGIVWDVEILRSFSLQLLGKKLIFSFDGTCTEAFKVSGTLSMVNLVDPLSAAASPIGGIPRFGRLHGDIYVCQHSTIGETMRPIGGIALILALVQVSETRDMLHMALTLFACALHQNPQNVRDMQSFRGYHLLALLLHPKMPLFDLHSLDIFFQISACEASFHGPKKPEKTTSPLTPPVKEPSFDDLSKFDDASFGSHADMDAFSELDNVDIPPTETSNCVVLSNPDMVEYVLLDWTLWVASTVQIQITLLGFLENLVSMHWYRNHNLTVLRKINLVQHLLVTLHRGDVEVPVLEKLVNLLMVILKDGFLTSELEHVVRFVIMTFDPPELTSRNQILRESMGKHVIVRNMLLEMLIDLLVTVSSEEVLEHWHRIVSSKLITFFFDEGVHPTTMRWVMTLLGVCLTSSSSTFSFKFRTGGGYLGLVRVLPSFYDSPDIYYILFCLIFGKPVYPRLPEVRLLDFHALIPNDGSNTELKFLELLDSVIAMVKSTFDRVSIRTMIAYESNAVGVVAELVDACTEMTGELQGEALMHKTYAARLMGGDAAAPAAATSVVRFMVDLAKICPPFSAVCRRAEFLDKCVDLYFSCVRSAHAVKMAKNLTLKTEEKNLNDCDEVNGSQSSLPLEQEQYSKTSMSLRSFPPSTISEDAPVAINITSPPPESHSSPESHNPLESHNPVQEVNQKTTPESLKPVEVADTESDNKELSFPDDKTTTAPESQNPVGDVNQAASTAESGDKDFSFHDQKTTPESENPVQVVDQVSTAEFSFHDDKTTPPPESHNPVPSTAESGTKDFGFHNRKKTTRQASSLSSVSLNIFDSPYLSEKGGVHKAQSSSQLFAMGSWQSPSFIESKPKLAPSPSMASSVSMTLSLSEYDTTSSDPKRNPQLPNPIESYFPISPPLLLDAEDSGYGGGPCSAGATAILDFMAEVLSDFVTDQLKAVPAIETILENVPLYIDAESLLVFQGLCLSRVMNFLERRILRDDEEDEKKLDKTRWSTNLDALCLTIVDRVYMGAFPEPSGVLRTLEFLLSMLQLANKDGRIEQAGPPGKGILSIGRGKQLDAYILSMFKNMNRTIMYCFHPQFLISVGEDELLSRLGLQIEQKNRSISHSEEDGVIDISTVLQVLVAHKRLIFCPSNTDNDLICCLCINITSLLHDQRQHAQNSALEILKYLLVYRKTALEDIFVSKPNQGTVLDAFHGGFDRLVTGTTSSFFDWFNASEILVSKTLEQSAANMWVQYIAGSVKLPGVRIKSMDTRRKKEIIRKSKESRKFDQRHWEQINERRIALKSVCDQMCTELRVVRQDKYGWVLHAESEWQTHLQQLVHERGIFPVLKSNAPAWQLCPIEGPYRMRKKIERCKLKSDVIETILNGEFDLPTEKDEIDLRNPGSGSGSEFLPQEIFVEELYDDSVFKEKDMGVGSARIGWNNNNINDGRERDDSVYEASVQSAVEFSIKSGTTIATPPLKRDASVISENVKIMEEKEKEKVEKELSDNGEHLIRPYLEHNEKIKSKYNCERVVSLDKHDGIFLIGERSLYIIENFYIDDSGSICEKASEDDLSVIDQALGVKKDASLVMDSGTKSRDVWAPNSGAWGRENAVNSTNNVSHLWRMWKLSSIHEVFKRDYQLRPVAIEIFSMDGCNDLLVFHKKERDEVHKNLPVPKNSMVDPTISGAVKQESTLKFMDKSFQKRWQNGEISNFQYLMHINTFAGRGYSDLTQYPVFPWILSDYENENLDFTNPETFRKLDKPMGCQTMEGEIEFKKRFDSWDDPEIPKFHYGSHYSSAGIVLFYLIRLPPFSSENQKLQGGQFDHADRLFHNIHDTWSSAAGKSNTSDVKELIPEFFYLPEFLENRFDLDLGEKQSGEKIGDVGLPPWAKGSTREFIKKHREALESDYVSENLHHWIDLIFGYKQRGKAAEEAVNVFYHYTYEGSVDIDAVSDPAMKAAILAQINHFGQTPRQIFSRPHVKRKTDRKPPLNPLKISPRLTPHEIRKMASPISQIVTLNDKILIAGPNNFIKPRTYTKYVAWGFPDRSLRFMTYDQDRLLSTHENLHGGHQVQCASASQDGETLVTGADDGMVCVWRIGTHGGSRVPRSLNLQQSLCAHTAKITRVYVSQPYMMIVSGSDDCTVILWDLSTLVFIRQLPEFPFPISSLFMNDLTGEIITAAGALLSVWSVNGECLAAVNTSQLPSDFILSVATCTWSDWVETNWYVSGHQSGAIKVWQMVHNSLESGSLGNCGLGLGLGGKVPEYGLVLHKVMKGHKYPVTALHVSSDLKLLLSGDSDGHLFSWTLPDESLRNSIKWG